MAVLSSAANGGTAQKVASLKWSDETIEVETCGRSYWSFLQRARAIDNKQLGNVSAFAVDVEVDEEVRWLGEGGRYCAEGCSGGGEFWIVVVSRKVVSL